MLLQSQTSLCMPGWCSARAVYGFQVKQLIGTFSLDPNRACDLVYDAYECFPSQAAFLKLLPLFGTAAMLQMLGFKFQLEHVCPSCTKLTCNHHQGCLSVTRLHKGRLSWQYASLACCRLQ